MNILILNYNTTQEIISSLKKLGHKTILLVMKPEGNELRNITSKLNADQTIYIDITWCSRSQLFPIMENIIEQYKIDLIYPTPGIDHILDIIGYINTKYNLPGMSTIHTDIFFNKSKYLPLLEQENILTPKTYRVVNNNDIEIDTNSITFPCICKPGLGSGSMGVYVIENAAQLKWFFGPLEHPEHFSKRFLLYKEQYANGYRNYVHTSYENDYLIQEFIEGLDVTTFGIKVGDKIKIIMTYDMYMSPLPYRSEVHSVYPSLNKNIPEKVKQTVHKIINTVPFPDGPFMFDFVLNNDNLYVVDIGIRTSASGTNMLTFCHEQHKSIIDAMEAILNHKLTETEYNIPPLSMRYFDFKKGKIKKIIYPLDHKFMVAKDIKIKNDSTVYELRSDLSLSQNGYVIMTGYDAEHAVKNSNDYINSICVEYYSK